MPFILRILMRQSDYCSNIIPTAQWNTAIFMRSIVWMMDCKLRKMKALEICKIIKSCMLMLQNAFKTECSYILDAVLKPQDQRLCQISEPDFFIMIWGNPKVKITKAWMMNRPTAFLPSDEAEAQRVWLNLCKHTHIHHFMDLETRNVDQQKKFNSLCSGKTVLVRTKQRFVFSLQRLLLSDIAENLTTYPKSLA